MSAGPLIRRAGPADVEAVRALTLAAYAKWVPIMGRKPRPMVADYDRAVVDHRIDLIEEANLPAALVETVLRPDDLLIVNLAVHPAHQGRGLGRRLLGHAEALASEAGRPFVRLYTNAKMTGNIALYGGFGYVEDRREQAEVGTIVHMVKTLPRG